MEEYSEQVDQVCVDKQGIAFSGGISRNYLIYAMDFWILDFCADSEEGLLQISVPAIWMDTYHNFDDCRAKFCNYEQHLRGPNMVYFTSIACYL